MTSSNIKGKPVAIVLGGTNPHRYLIVNLKERGYFTVLIDYLENPPAKEVADHHVQESTLDKDKVLEIAKEIGAGLVIATCIDQANVTACYVAENMGLPHPYSYETARLIANKIEMKKKLMDDSIPTSKFKILQRNEDVYTVELPSFPLVVKPADTGGSKGVRKVNTRDELRYASTKAFEVSKLNEVLIEEYISGINVDAVCFIGEGEAQILILRQRFGIRDESGAVLQYFHSIIPANISSMAINRILEIANSIATSFKIVNSPLQLQLIVNGDEAKVIEFAPRIGGGLSFKTVGLIHGIDLIDTAIETYFQKNKIAKNIKSEGYYSEVNIYSGECEFQKLNGITDLLESNIVEAAYCYKVRGDKINSDLASKDRVGSFIVRGETQNVLSTKIGECIRRIEVIDSHGRDVLKRELYKNLFQ